LNSLRCTLLALALFFGLRSAAQVYPVQATVQLAPPYSLYLADYVESGTERLALNVFLGDIARPQLDVRFRLKIIGQGITIETKQSYIPPPISIQGGVPLRLISTDLADYFNPNNLEFQGFTRRQYEQRGMLPEGVYQFCFEVLEYNRGVKISNTACAVAWMILNDPPMINLPRQDEKLKTTSPQNVLMQWTPRHTASPNSAFSTEYDVTMVEVWPATRNPNDAILTSPPIYEATTTSTTIIYGPAETPLEPGRRYAFRVRARSIAGIDQLDLFKNNGYSEVFTFVYGDACDLPTGISVASVSSTRFSLAWDGLFNHTDYRIRYRQTGTLNWYENSVSLTSSEITSLKPNTTYEYQVAASCGFYDGQYSPVARVTTAQAPETSYSCGVPLETFNLDPANLTGSLKPGDIINAGDFDVKLIKVSGSNGVFTGDGVIEVPYFNKAKVKVSFSNITVNKELRLVNGHLDVTGAGVDVIPEGLRDAIEKLDEALEVIDSALTTIEDNLPESFDPNSFVPDTLIDVKEGIQSVYKDDDGTVVVVDRKGNEQRLPPGTTAAIKDSNGNGYLVDNKGNIHKTTADVAAKAGNRELNLSLNFAGHRDMKYGLDGYKYPALRNDYEHLKGDVPVAWKSVASGAPDVVTAILGNATGIDKSKITFEMGGAPVQASPMQGQSTSVTIQGQSEGVEEGLIALYAPSDTSKQQVLGKLNVASYNKISHSVVIVPVNDVALPGGLTDRIIQDSLNAIYGQAVVDWKVTVVKPVKVELPAIFDDGETGMLSNYTADMKKVINTFGDLDDDTYYLFLVNNAKTGRELGYMPRGKQAGFIFVNRHGSNAGALVRTMAHELGHGAFNLHHTFKEPNITLREGDTDNLMDYPAGHRLYKFQWDKMRYPDIVIGLFEEDEEAAMFSNDLLLVKDYLIDGRQIERYEVSEKLSYVTPSGKIIKLPSDAKVSFGAFLENSTSTQAATSSKNAVGVVMQFFLGGKVYGATFSQGVFLGYYASGKGPAYAGISDDKEGNVIIGAEFNDCKLKFLYGRYLVKAVPNYRDLNEIKFEDGGELIGVKAVDPSKCIPCSIPLADKPDQIQKALNALELAQGRVDNYLASVPEAHMRSFICAEDRFKMINNISEGILVGAEDEQTIIKLIRSTPDDQVNTLITLFKNDNTGALQELYSSIDGDELTEFFAEMSKLYYKYLGAEYNQKVSEIDNTAQAVMEQYKGDCFVFYEMAKKNVFVFALPQPFSSKKVDFIYDVLSALPGMGVNNDGSVGFLMDVDGYCLPNTWTRFEVAPFDLVKIYYLKDNLKEDSDVGYLPGYAMRWLLNNYNNTQIAIGVNKGMIVASIFTLGTTSSITAIIFATVDLVVAEGNLIILQQREEFSKTEQGRKLMNAWSEVNKYVAIGQGVYLLFGVAKNIYMYKAAVSELKLAFKEWKFKDFDELKARNPALAAKLENFGISGIQKLEDLIAEYELQVQNVSKTYGVSREVSERLLADDEFLFKLSKGEAIDIQAFLTKLQSASNGGMAFRGTVQQFEKEFGEIWTKNSGTNGTSMHYEFPPDRPTSMGPRSYSITETTPKPDGSSPSVCVVVDESQPATWIAANGEKAYKNALDKGYVPVKAEPVVGLVKVKKLTPEVKTTIEEGGLALNQKGELVVLKPTNAQQAADAMLVLKTEEEVLMLRAVGKAVEIVTETETKEKEKNECAICKERTKVNPELCLLLEEVIAKSSNKTKANAAIVKLCAVPVLDLTNAELKAIAQKLTVDFAGAEIAALSGNIVGASDETATTYLSNSLGKIDLGILNTWKYFYTEHKDKAPHARKYLPALTRFQPLTDKVKQSVIKFSDTKDSESTLKKFSDKLDATTNVAEDQSLTKFLNDHPQFAEGFVGHHRDPAMDKQEYDLLREELKDIPITSSLSKIISSQLDYSSGHARRQGYCQLGHEFEEEMKNELLNPGSSLYLELEKEIKDLSERTIYYQAYMCTNNSRTCTKEKQYFIADFVFVKKVAVEGEAPYWDIIVADTKLSESTGFTKNQEKGRGMNSYFVRTTGARVAGPVLEDYDVGDVVMRNAEFDFVKIFSDGNKIFKGIKWKE
jgi:TANFOR domain-containing protein